MPTKLSRVPNGLLGRGRCDIDLRFELRQERIAAVTVWGEIVPGADAEIGAVAGNTEFGALVEHRHIEEIAGDVDVAVKGHGGVIDPPAAGRLGDDRLAADREERLWRGGCRHGAV
jgi:hypothetical protein